MKLRVESIAMAATDVRLIELAPTDDATLPRGDAGAHIDVHLPSGLVRQYSLVNGPRDEGCYRIAVHLSPTSRGGSSYMHASLRVGSLLEVTGPRNNFALADSAAAAVFIAGGIGITPLWSMIQKRAALGRPWCLYYCARSEDRAAFLAPLRALARPGQLIEVFDRGVPENGLDLRGVVEAQAPDAHLYCCGPGSMIDAFEACAAKRDPRTVHFERFTSRPASPADDPASAFRVQLSRSKLTVDIGPGESILDRLLACGIDVPHACKEGICGSCETRVLDGVPDHRDSVLGPFEKLANQTMMLCVSRCKGASITLDL